MAVLANGLTTLEFGAVWRTTMNTNFDLLMKASSVLALLTGKSLTTHNHDLLFEVTATTITQTELQPSLQSIGVDLKFTNNTEGITVIDGVTLSETRIYVDNGVISTEVVV